MFSGITQGLFPVVALERKSKLLKYEVQLSSSLVSDLKIGASIAVDGVCQSVSAINGERVTFEAVEETLKRTTLGEYAIGRKVSIERSLRIGDELGGHLLSGHISGTASVAAVKQEEGGQTLALSVPETWLPYIFEKGFIAVDGSSLTVGEVMREAKRFHVYLIPDTLRRTRLGELKVGDKVNIELDGQTVAIVDTVARVLAERD